MLSVTGARLVVTEPRIRILLGRSLSQARPQLGYRLADELISEGNERGQSGHPEEGGRIQFSSGATMDPKPVCLTHRNLLYQCPALPSLLLQSSPPAHRRVAWLP